MVCSILGSEPIHRIDVNFNVQTKNLDSFIGRTAHINLIIQQSLFKIINTTIPDLFDIRKQWLYLLFSVKNPSTADLSQDTLIKIYIKLKLNLKLYEI